MDSRAAETGAGSVSSLPDLSSPMVESSDLHSSVADRHRHLDPTNWDDIYLVGDVHGCARELSRLVEVLDLTRTDLLVFVGDLVRKGPDNKAVVEFVRAHDNMVSVRGNNEDKLIHDRKTLDSLGPADQQYLESLPVALSLEDSIVVHGGVDPTRPLVDQTAPDLLTCRSIPPENGYDGPFWFEQYQGPPRVFFGHTVLDDPVQTEWAVGLDTGCVYGGALTAYDYHGDEFVQIPAFETYETRADHKFLDADVVQG